MGRDPKKIPPEDWAALRFEANQLFTPSTAILVAELFAGRQKQIGKLLDAVSERGRHAIVYGEPGVGKIMSGLKNTRQERFAQEAAT